jgi:hypothetical protein
MGEDGDGAETRSDGATATDTGTDDETVTEADTVSDDETVTAGGSASDVVAAASHEQTIGLGWLAVGVLVLAAVALLLVGLVLDEPLAASATELGIGFAWLLAAAYVGFRVPGSPRLRLLGAGSFLLGATAQFLSLVAAQPVLEAASLLGPIVGALALVVLVVRAPESSTAD